MAIESDLRRAEQTGVTIPKEKLIQLLRGIKQQQFVVVQGRNGSYVIVPVAAVK